MAAELRIESLYDEARVTFRSEYDRAVQARDHFQSKLRNRFGEVVGSEIQRHVDVALGRLQAEDVSPEIMKQRVFYELLALEQAVEEIQRQIDAGAVFHDSDHGLLPTLGLSWEHDVVPLIDGEQIYMPIENVVKFLGMVRGADQRLPSGEESADHFRGKRRELIEFLDRTVALGEAVWCVL
jgi:hypothetical protein